MSDQPSLGEILAHATLTEVVGRTLEARREGALPCERVNYETEWGAAVQGEQVGYEVRATLGLLGGDAQRIATLSASFTVAFLVLEASRFEGKEEAVAELAGFAVLAAHPYLRTAIGQLALQVGIAPVTLGLLRAGAAHPDTVTVIDRVFSLDSPS